MAGHHLSFKATPGMSGVPFFGGAFYQSQNSLQVHHVAACEAGLGHFSPFEFPITRATGMLFSELTLSPVVNRKQAGTETSIGAA